MSPGSAMSSPRSPARCLLLSLLLLTAGTIMSPSSRAGEWRDAKGAVFKGEPVEVVGPLAVFYAGRSEWRTVKLSALSPEDCRRFQQAIAKQPARAARWKDARSSATGQLVDRL